MRIKYDSVHYIDDSHTTISVNGLEIDDHKLGNCVNLIVTSQLAYLIIQHENSENRTIKTFHEDDESHNLSLSELIKEIQDSVQSIIDSTAQEKLYDNGLALCGYINSTNEQFRNEAQRFIKFRDDCWVKCYEILDAYNAGEIARPTVSDVIKQMPVFSWEE